MSFLCPDDVFDKPTRTRVDRSGKVVRRTILMESPGEEEEAAEEQAPPPLPADLSSDQLRALANLEDKRRRGEVTEAEYMAERRETLDPQPDP